jgi:hypothetical protein
LPPPTAANVSIGGRVRTGKQGIANVIVSLTDARGTVRSVKTNTFGYYNFNDVPLGTNIITVTAKRYAFENPTQVLNVADNISDLDFAAIE